MNRFLSKQRPRALSCILLFSFSLLFILGAGPFVWDALIRPIFYSNPARIRERACTTNLKSIGRAVLVYAHDWDEHLPLDNRWAAKPGGFGPYDINSLRCPDAISPYGYALNARVAGISLAAIADLSHRVAVFESDNQKTGAMTGTQTLPLKPRHGGRDAYIFLDGHYKALPRSTNVSW